MDPDLGSATSPDVPSEGSDVVKTVLEHVTFTRSDQQGRRTLAISGEPDLAAEKELGRQLTAVIDESHSPACVDLSDVSYMDSTTINALIGAARVGRSRGTRLVLGPVSPRCRRVMEVAGVWDAFEHSQDD